MSTPFNKRVFGCAIIKSLNSNYNADFSHQPRTLPNGVVYATDKALKYTVRNYWKNALDENVFYFKSFTEEMSPRTLDENYEKNFGKTEEKDKNKLRLKVLKNLLNCLDVRVFGGTFASNTKGNISIHGTTQFTHGVNQYGENIIYSEQIMSPFRNSNDNSNESTQTTLGTQSKLQEGHYVHHFSINPKNIQDDVTRVAGTGLTETDIEKLKEGLRKGATYYDSAAKAGTENELLLWIQLKEGSLIVLPSFVELVTITEKRTIDLKEIKKILSKSHIKSEIEKIELFYNKGLTQVENIPEGSVEIDL